MIEISTDRLIIRPLRTTDYESWFKGFSQRQPSQNPFDEGLLDMSICTQEWFNELVQKHDTLRQADDTYIFAIFDKKTQHHIGMIDIATLARANMNWGEIGYFIHNQLWRKGYAFEALTAILKLASNQLGFHRIEAHVSIPNTPSQELLKKLGFSFETTREKFMFEFGEWADKKVYFYNLNNTNL
ncbi:GNAT family N-acetyltransferase [Weissella sagaensis]|uniref:GNAT family N-acetyltransferase n=1 Tax=Weissella sagaensis TaxID=2559928 RepID=A0ABW1RTP6_9LACO|nr:GNAT family N-acetyltransferase [Weissella sagaensis]UEG66901.1 GNAT family N-acetyltransferase [Weissella hellenica]